MDLSAQPASPQVESGYLTTFLTMGLGRMTLNPDFGDFFLGGLEAVRRVL
jgi:hypothetical protein